MVDQESDPFALGMAVGLVGLGVVDQAMIDHFAPGKAVRIVLGMVDQFAQEVGQGTAVRFVLEAGQAMIDHFAPGKAVRIVLEAGQGTAVPSD